MPESKLLKGCYIKDYICGITIGYYRCYLGGILEA